MWSKTAIWAALGYIKARWPGPSSALALTNQQAAPMCLCAIAIALDRTYRTSNVQLLNHPQKNTRWEGARRGDVQRFRIESQQPRAIYIFRCISFPWSRCGCDPGGADVPSAKSNYTFTMAPARSNTRERIENQKKDEDAVWKEDAD
jgi:hypothetical protein